MYIVNNLSFLTLDLLLVTTVTASILIVALKKIMNQVLEMEDHGDTLSAGIIRGPAHRVLPDGRFEVTIPPDKDHGWMTVIMSKESYLRRYS